MDALRALYPEFYIEIQAALRVITREVASSAVANADTQGLSPPGRSGRGEGNLIGSIRGGVTHTKGWIKDDANRDGYYYPRLYEYADAGERAFMRPAVDQNRGKIYSDLDAALERVKSKFNESGL